MNKPKDLFGKIFCSNKNYRVYVIDCFSSESEIKEVFKYLMGITLIAYHAVTDEKGDATFLLISTKKYGFVFYMNEKRSFV